MNIQRGRDHGLPGYVEYRKICQIGTGSSFNELKSNISPKVSTKHSPNPKREFVNYLLTFL